MAKPYKGYPSQYAYRKATGTYTPGTTGAARARRAKAIASGTYVPPPPKPRRGQWSQPTPRGTRDMTTKGRTTFERAVREAKRNGKDVLFGVSGEFKTDSPTRRMRDGQTYAWSSRLDPDDVLQAIRDEGGNVEAGIKAVMELNGTIVERIDQIVIKEFSR